MLDPVLIPRCHCSAAARRVHYEGLIAIAKLPHCGPMAASLSDQPSLIATVFRGDEHVPPSRRTEAERAVSRPHPSSSAEARWGQSGGTPGFDRAGPPAALGGEEGPTAIATQDRLHGSRVTMRSCRPNWVTPRKGSTGTWPGKAVVSGVMRFFATAKAFGRTQSPRHLFATQPPPRAHARFPASGENEGTVGEPSRKRRGAITSVKVSGSFVSS